MEEVARQAVNIVGDDRFDRALACQIPETGQSGSPKVGATHAIINETGRAADPVGRAIRFADVDLAPDGLLAFLTIR